MRRCRRTITRLVARGELKKIPVKGSRRAWFRLKEVELLSGFGTSLKSTDEKPHHRFLKMWHPEVFA